MYGPVGIMFGKFHAGEEETTRAGRRIPAAPVSFLPVRAAVRRRDPGSSPRPPTWPPHSPSPRTTAASLLEHVPDQWKEIKTWAKRFLPR